MEDQPQYAPNAAPDERPAAPPPAPGFDPYPLPREYTDDPGGAEAPGSQQDAQPDWQTRIQDAEARAAQAEQQAQRLNAAFGELQSMAQRAEQEAAEARLRDESQSRINQLYSMAADMDPETGFQYIRRGEDQERAHLARRIQDTKEQSEQQMFATVAQIAAPMYAREKAKELGLSEKYGEMLAGVRADQIDALAPILKHFNDQEALMQNQIEQLSRSTGAQALMASGAFNPSGNGATPVRPETSRLDPRSPDYEPKALLGSVLERMGVMRRQ